VPARVLVPGAGGAAAIGAIKALRMAGYRGQIVATDVDALSPGLELADVGAVLPRATAPDFLPRAMELMRRERVEAVLPTSGAELPVLAAHAETLRAAGVTVVGCDADVIETCVDSARFAARVGADFPLAREQQPWPREGLMGAASGGATYAVDVLCDLAARPLVAVPRLRLAVNDGVSVRGQVLHDEGIETLALRLALALGVKGPACVQLHRGSDDVVRVVEVQPWLGAAAFFSALAGVNLAACCLDLAAGRPLPALRFVEIAVARYFEEIVLIGQDRRRRRPGAGTRPGEAASSAAPSARYQRA
jgi:carbamoyl-phosphate synthase large subunit